MTHSVFIIVDGGLFFFFFFYQWGPKGDPVVSFCQSLWLDDFWESDGSEKKSCSPFVGNLNWPSWRVVLWDKEKKDLRKVKGQWQDGVLDCENVN